MADKSIGFIETFGLTAAIAAADAAVKAANVKLLGYEYAKGDGMCTVKVEGNVGACKAAIAAGKRAAEMVQGTHQGTKSVLLKARPADGIKDLLIYTRENVGGDLALAEGYRPKGESRMPVLVKHWKPKEEPKVEAPMEEAPETPVVEALKEEPVIEETEPVETEPEANSEEAESVEAPETEEPVPVEAPEEAPAPVEAPETEEPAPVEAPEAKEPAPVEAPETEDPAPEEAPATEETEKAEAPKKTTSTGNRRSGRSKKKKNTDK